MAIVRATWAERPDLQDHGLDDDDIWPEYNQHGAVLSRYWPRLPEQFADWQFTLYDDDTGQVLAEGHSLPCPWDGTDEGLPQGIDEAVVAAFASGRPPGAVCALAAEVAPSARVRGLSAAVLQHMRELAAAHGLPAVFAPVRPSWKERYPLTPIEEYVTWRREDGTLFDPWMRVHERLGARLVRVAPRSLEIVGSVADWEGWTQMAFPASGTYVFPRGLATVEIDRDADTGTYWEPNVWFVHTVDRAG